MKEVLVPLDGTDHAELALSLAQRFAKSLDAGLCLVAIHPADEELWAAAHIDLSAELSHRRAWLEEYLQGVATKARAEGVKVRWSVHEGEVNQQLRDAAAEPDVVMVAMTTSGAGFQGVPSTSVTDRLVRARSKPVLVVPPQTSSEEWAGLLVALDGSEAAEQALPLAREIAKGMNAVLHLVHVVDANPGWALPADAQERLTTSLTEWGEAYLKRVAKPNDCTAVLDGPVLDAIFGYAEAAGCGGVVLATHGRSGPERLELGSVADAVVHETGRPVLLFPIAGAAS